MKVEYSDGSLTTRKNKADGYYYCAQFRYREAGGWKTRLVTLKDEHGMKISAGKGMTKNKTAAKDAMRRARRELGGIVMDGTISVPDYVRADIEGRRGTKLQDSTIRSYLDLVHLFDGLADVRMRDLRPRDVRRWVRKMVADGRSPRYVRKAYNVLYNVCERAVEDDDLETNPCTAKIRHEELPEVGSPLATNFLDADGINRVNRMLDVHRNPRLRIGARIALHCGLRAQEVCGLQWGSVDFENNVIRVSNVIGNRGSVMPGGADVTPQYSKIPKSKAGNRPVPMTETVVHELKEWRKEQMAEWEELGKVVPFDECYVIGYADGSYYRPHSLEHEWGRLAKGLHARSAEDGRKRDPERWEPGREPIMNADGTEVVSFHGLRHTCATAWLRSGVDIKTVAAQLGHADPSLTLRAYVGSDSKAVQEGAEKAAPLLEAGTRRRMLRAV